MDALSAILASMTPQQQAQEMPPDVMAMASAGGDVPMPVPRPTGLGINLRPPTVPGMENLGSTPSSESAVGGGSTADLLRLAMQRQQQGGGGGAGLMDQLMGGLGNVPSGLGRSKSGALAAGFGAGIKGAQAAAAAAAKAQQDKQNRIVDMLKVLGGMEHQQGTAAETKRYHDIMADYYKGTLENGRAKTLNADPDSIAYIDKQEEARARAARRFGLDKTQTMTPEEKAAAQEQYDNWDSQQPWSKRLTEKERNAAGPRDENGLPLNTPEPPQRAGNVPATSATPAAGPGILDKLMTMFGMGGSPAAAGPAPTPPPAAMDAAPAAPLAAPGDTGEPAAPVEIPDAAVPVPVPRPRGVPSRAAAPAATIETDAMGNPTGGGAPVVSSAPPGTPQGVWRPARNPKTGERILFNLETGETQKLD